MGLWRWVGEQAGFVRPDPDSRDTPSARRSVGCKDLNMARKHVLVVGAGPAGLAAGVTLLEEGTDVDVTLLNLDHTVGGKAKSWIDVSGASGTCFCPIGTCSITWCEMAGPPASGTPSRRTTGSLGAGGSDR